MAGREEAQWSSGGVGAATGAGGTGLPGVLPIRLGTAVAARRCCGSSGRLFGALHTSEMATPPQHLPRACYAVARRQQAAAVHRSAQRGSRPPFAACAALPAVPEDWRPQIPSPPALGVQVCVSALRPIR